jgi:hypothetical protein
VKDELLIIGGVLLVTGGIVAGLSALFGGVHWDRVVIFLSGYLSGRLLGLRRRAA